MTENIQDELLDIPVSPNFDIFKEKGTRRRYKGITITLGQKKFDDIWHYWWFAQVNNTPYGFTFLAEGKHKELKELAFYAAEKSIDKLLGETSK